MSNPSCSSASLVEAFPCLSPGVLPSHLSQAIRIWFMTKELAALGGTDYTAVLDSTLISDAVTFGQTMNLAQRDTALMAIYANNAVAAGASIPTDPSVLADNVKCLRNYTELQYVELMLLCKLGTHKTFPQ